MIELSRSTGAPSGQLRASDSFGPALNKSKIGNANPSKAQIAAELGLLTRRGKLFRDEAMKAKINLQDHITEEGNTALHLAVYSDS